MNFKQTILAVAIVCGATANSYAGGYLTNSNQSISFLRNPARDAAIGIDGVYSNPAGVAFMNEGFHIGLNWQNAIQARTVETTSPYLDHTLGAVTDPTNISAPTKRYRGHATAPFVPSVQAAYNKSKWSFQFNFAVAGGGGKCEFEKGIGTFESAVGQIATQLSALGVKGYGVDNYMEGRQFYYGITLGAAYKVNKHISVYGGLRGLIGHARYIAQVKDIQVATSDGLLNLGTFIDQKGAELSATSAYLTEVINKTKPYYDQYGSQLGTLKAAVAAGQTQYADLVTAIEGYQTAVAAQPQVAAGQAGLNALSGYRNGIDLESTQNGFGIAPLFGVDIKYGQFNFAAKYEFRTKMSLKNNSNLETASVGATAQFVNGSSVREDSPAMLTVGAQWTPVNIVRINLGYHHYYDMQAKKTYFYTDETGASVRSDEKNKLLSCGTNEYLGGVEVNCTDRLIVSAGAQITRYGNTNDYMSDISFNVNSWSFGFGASYQANPNVKIEAAYFKTLYGHYKNSITSNGITTSNDFTRTNDVIGVGLVIDL